MRRLVLLSVAILVAQPSAGAFATKISNASIALAKGKAYFKKKEYNVAVYQLKGALEADPENAEAYYYLANALVHTHRHKEAIQAYRRSYELEPFGPMSGFCRQALLTYHAPIPIIDLDQFKKKKRDKMPLSKQEKLRKKGVVEAEIASAKEASDSEDSENAVEEARPEDQHKRNASAQIRKQLEDEKYRKKKFTDDLSDVVVKTGEAKAARIRAEAEEQIKELYEGPVLYDSQGVARFRGVPAWRLSPILQEAIKARADQIRREADEKAQLETSIAHERSSQYKKWCLERHEDLDAVADSLETQLYKPGASRSGIVLNPIGTGLYVRNYSQLSPKHPIPEAHSSVVRIIEKDADPNRESSEFKEPPGFQQSKEVQGKVLY